MPLPGEETAKLGFRYEDLWTVNSILEILSGSADEIHLVALGEEGEGVEFTLHRTDTKEFHQVKRQQSATGHWTISTLNDVLLTFKEKLKEADTTCFFVSMQEAYPLRELSENAASSHTYEELRSNYFKEGNRVASFEKLSKVLSASNDGTFAFLRRAQFVTIDQERLQRLVNLNIQLHVEGDSEIIRASLIELSHSKVHQNLSSKEIWNFLESKGFRRTNWAKDTSVLSKLSKQNQRYIDSLRSESILGKPIDRPDVEKIFQAVTKPSNKTLTLITGIAGVGKSTTLVQVIENLLNTNVPVLAFRLDLLKAVYSPKEVGTQLEIPASPPLTLAKIAQNKPSVLVIDQLDAVSMVSGRNPQFLDCVNEMIKEAEELKTIHVILSCRKFDLDNDDRLRKLKQNPVTEIFDVLPLSREVVREVVKQLGLDDSKLTDGQIKLLSIPLHLKLLAEIVHSGNASQALGFDTVKELYDRFWTSKRAFVENACGRSIAWWEVLGRLSQWMSENQSLTAPKSIVNKWSTDAAVLASEHVLAEDLEKYSFFHESFFDYCFAQTFLAEGGQLPKLLLDDEQALFRRSQVRQILLHERIVDPKTYIKDLGFILTGSKIRIHLKQLVLAVLKEIRNPSVEELSIVVKCLDDASCEGPAMTLFMKCPPWFDILDTQGYLQDLLSSSDQTKVFRAIRILMTIQDQCADRVATVLIPYLNKSDDWNRHIKTVLFYGDWSSSRKYFDLCIGLVKSGAMDFCDDEGAGGILQSGAILKLAKSKPDWALELITEWLEKVVRGDADLKSSETRGSILDRCLDVELIHEISKRIPVAFVEKILPIVFLMVQKTAHSNDRLPIQDGIWPFRFEGHRIGGDRALIDSLESALSEIARHTPDKVEEFFRTYSGNDFDTIQFLFIKALTANPAKFADLAIDYLCQRYSRLDSGYVGSYADHFDAAAELVKVVTPLCSEERLDHFIFYILDYYSDYERSAKGLKVRGYGQLVFLKAIDQRRITADALKRLNELRRKFPHEEVDEPSDENNSGSVPSPVPDHATEKMTDQQWLLAIAKYSGEHSWDGKGRIVGGAYQLSDSFATAAKKEPLRFASLAERLPDKTNPVYFDSLLRALAEVHCNRSLIFGIIRRCHRLTEKPCGRSICWALEKYYQEDIPDDIIEILQWYAVFDPSPANSIRDNDLYFAGINSVRGAAAEALGALIFAKKDIFPKVIKTIEQLIADPSIVVRSCVAKTLVGILNHDRTLAVNLFLQLVDADDRLLETPMVEDFLRYALYTHFEKLLPVLNRMLKSSIPKVREIAARRIWMAALDVSDARDLANNCLKRTEEERKGAATILAHNVSVDRVRAICEPALKLLFEDPAKSVRAVASSCFRFFETDEIKNYRELVQAFIESGAFPDNYDDLIRALDKTTAQVPDIICAACHKFLDEVGKDAANATKRAAATGYEVTQLAIRAYSQAKDKDLQSRGLDLIDRLMALGVYGVEKELSIFER